MCLSLVRRGRRFLPVRTGVAATRTKVMGTTTFCEASLLTAPGLVMTPRPATERLVAAAAERIRGCGACGADVGPRPGAIAPRVAPLAPGAEGWGGGTNPAAGPPASPQAPPLGPSQPLPLPPG